MKHICITYVMSGVFDGRRDVATMCITLPMTDEKAAELLENQSDSPLVMFPCGIIHGVLQALAILQGYNGGGWFASAEPDKDWESRE